MTSVLWASRQAGGQSRAERAGQGGQKYVLQG